MPLTLEMLLPLWAEKQPDWCWQVEGQKYIFRVAWDNDWHDLLIGAMQSEDFAIFEYAIREAIAEQCWVWGKTFSPESLVVSRDGTGRTLHCCPVDEAGGVPAIAILAAFLKALGVDLGGES